jgi:hypothetical protein
MFAAAIRGWISHLLGVDVSVEPLKEMREINLRWYVGLDADATKMGDRLWNDEGFDSASLARVVGLFVLVFDDPGIVLESVRGEPAYRILAGTSDHMLRMKLQNVVTGLSIRQLEAVG